MHKLTVMKILIARYLALIICILVHYIETTNRSNTDAYQWPWRVVYTEDYDIPICCRVNHDTQVAYHSVQLLDQVKIL